MKVHIVRNSKGDIIAINEEKTDVGAVGVVPPNGEEYEEKVVEAYPNYTWDLAAFYKKYQRRGTKYPLYSLFLTYMIWKMHCLIKKRQLLLMTWL